MVCQLAEHFNQYALIILKRKSSVYENASLAFFPNKEFVEFPWWENHLKNKQTESNINCFIDTLFLHIGSGHDIFVIVILF